MSTEAHVLAIGKFNPQIKELLDYPADWYDNCTIETTVVTHLFQCNSRWEVKLIADGLGIDPYDLSQHYLDNDYVLHKVPERDWSAISECGRDDWSHDLWRLLVLAEWGFNFIFVLDV